MIVEVLELPAGGVPLLEARLAIDALHGKSFVNRQTGISARLSSSARGKLVSNKASGITVKESKQHGHHIYSVEAVKLEKLEAFDRIVEVASGNTPHASNASLTDMIAFSAATVNGGK